MRTIRSILVFLSLVTCLARAVPAQASYDRFVREYEAAEKTGEPALMQKTIRATVSEAISYYTEIVKAYIVKPVEPLRQRIETFKENFTALYGSDLPAKIEEFYADLDADKRLPLAGLESGFNQMYSLHQTAQASRKVEDFRAAYDYAEDYLTKLADLGYALKAAEAALLAARVINEMPNRTKEDEKKCVAMLERFKELRNEWG
jgi:hypothetical protein